MTRSMQATKTLGWGLVALASVATLGGLVGGCAKGGSSRSQAPSLSSINSGAISATSTRDIQGYTWTQPIGLNTVANGAPTAMATVGSVTLVAVGPVGESVEVVVASVTTVSVTDRKTGFLFQPGSLAVIGSSAYAGTVGDVAGSGDIYLRTTNNWNRVVDGDRPRVVMGSLDGGVYGFGGGRNTTPVINYLAVGATSWDRRTDLIPSACVPTSVTTHFNQIWLGGGPTTAAGQASLYRGTFTTGFQQVPLPLTGAGANTRQEVSAMISGSSGLVVAIADTDATTDQALGGSIWFFGYGETTRLATLNQEAPLSLALHEGTIFVGTSSGRLLYRDPIGNFLEEPKVPTNQGVTSLFSQSAGVLLVGLRTVNGARLAARIGNSNKPVTTGGGATTSYLTTIKPLLQASCVSCHATMTTGYPLSSGLTNDTADYAATIAEVTTQNASMSQLLRKASGAVSHVGGAVWPQGSSQYDAVLQWINDNVPLGATSGGGGTTPDPTYVTDVKPILQSLCVSCHSGLPSNMPLSAGLSADMTDYNSVKAETNAANPAQSDLLRRAIMDAGVTHPIMSFSSGSTQYNTLLKWIQTGTKFN